MSDIITLFRKLERTKHTIAILVVSGFNHSLSFIRGTQMKEMKDLSPKHGNAPLKGKERHRD